jgi:hypothetical protein
VLLLSRVVHAVLLLGPWCLVPAACDGGRGCCWCVCKLPLLSCVKYLVSGVLDLFLRLSLLIAGTVAVTVVGVSTQTAITERRYSAHMFAEAQSEIFRLMDRDSFATRFLPAIRKRFGGASCAGAPLCMPRSCVRACPFLPSCSNCRVFRNCRVLSPRTLHDKGQLSCAVVPHVAIFPCHATHAWLRQWRGALTLSRLSWALSVASHRPTRGVFPCHATSPFVVTLSRHCDPLSTVVGTDCRVYHRGHPGGGRRRALLRRSRSRRSASGHAAWRHHHEVARDVDDAGAATPSPLCQHSLPALSTLLTRSVTTWTHAHSHGV